MGSDPGAGLPAVPSDGPVPVPPRTAPSPPKTVGAIGAGGRERSADLAAHILALGTGCALMGLGLGYLGVRLRRGL
ncbi:hypothetical protein [Streptomyces sp. NPDC051567]|uniref:hypothetical protein n=1 Tax=Streptomyces sp. NPDC051567 TaxID=3365660 RepID=UPI0037A77717